MKHTVLPNGDLHVTLDPADDREEIAKWRGNEWWELFADGGLRLQGEGWSYVAPEWIGALTDAPILTDDCTYHDNGEHEVCGNIWWFPNYQVEDVIDTLIRDGAVTFTRAEDACIERIG
jgi:hypothetical protein